jgi:hypothetical protein
MTKPKFEVGEQVHVRQANGEPGPTFYEITKLLPGGGCYIREEGTSNGKPYTEQRFDTSLLMHAVTDELLEAFSFGGRVKVGRSKRPI